MKNFLKKFKIRTSHFKNKNSSRWNEMLFQFIKYCNKIKILLRIPNVLKNCVGSFIAIDGQVSFNKK
jgi:hypothetical protein